MGVYVDELRRVGPTNRWPFPNSCHMYADTLPELHQMARRIGLKRQWFQDHPSLPHYDLNDRRRAKAVECGALEHSRYQMANYKMRRELRRVLERNRRLEQALEEAIHLLELYLEMDPVGACDDNCSVKRAQNLYHALRFHFEDQTLRPSRDQRKSRQTEFPEMKGGTHA